MITIKCRMGNFNILTLIVTLPLCKAFTVSVQEGEVTKFDFSYPCNSTRITLQYEDRAPFYNSAHPEYMPSNNTFKIKRRRDDCSIQLTIDPVYRDDSGTYILIAYENGIPIPDIARINLLVFFPPGKAYCKLSDYHLDTEWVSLQCTALLGSQLGQIDCYQNGVRLPNGNEFIGTDVNFTQIILARPDSVVYCCSSILSAFKDQCECTDWGWDPIRNSIIDVGDPCLTKTSTKFTLLQITTSNTSGNPIVKTTAEYPEYIVESDMYALEIMTMVILTLMIIHILISCFITRHVRQKRILRLVKRNISIRKKDSNVLQFGEKVMSSKEAETKEEKSFEPIMKSYRTEISVS